MIFGHQNSASSTPAEPAAIKTGGTSPDPLRLDPTDTVTTPSKLDDLDAPLDKSVLNQDTTPAPATAPPADDMTVTPTVSAAEPAEEPVLATPPDETPKPEDLLTLKQEALTQLTPLVDHLEQTPEERFRTTMMMIQSADNAALIKDAYSAAQEIKDDKVRAQALLDIVNEINYFTHKKDA